jgi:hypothetical protein
LLAHGRWFSPNTPASSTTKTGRHDIAEILLKVALNTTKSSLFDYMIILNTENKIMADKKKKINTKYCDV